MKIVHVEDFFHPDAGYQVNLLGRLQVGQGHQVTVVTAELDKTPPSLTDFFGTEDIPSKDLQFERETGVKVRRVPQFGYLSGRAIFRPWRLLRTVAEQQPDVVFLHCESTCGTMFFVCLARWLNYPLVIDSHMLEVASHNRWRDQFRLFYRIVITPIILRRKIPVIRLVDSDFVWKHLGIPLERTDLLSFGTDTSYFRPDPQVRASMRSRYGLTEDTFLVLYAGKLDKSKGGRFLADSLARKIAIPGGRPIAFMVIGNASGAYGEQLEAVFASSENTIIRIPTQRYFDTVQYYQAADLAVFPAQSSLSFFEVQSCGLPVLFEENEINSMRAKWDTAAFTFHRGDTEDLRAKIVAMADLPGPEYGELRSKCRNLIVSTYNYVPIAAKFTKVLEGAVAAWGRTPASG
jgi:glycosyltransferase involved in cell wall biosynthesis